MASPRRNIQHALNNDETKTQIAGGGACALIVALIVARVLSGGAPVKATQTDKPIPVTAAVASPHDVPLYRNGIGTLQAFNTVTIRPRLDCELVNVAFPRRPGGEIAPVVYLYLYPGRFGAWLSGAKRLRQTSRASDDPISLPGAA